MKSHLLRLYYRTRYSIGFYPTIVSMAYLAFALAVVNVQSSFLWNFLKPYLTWSLIPMVWNDKVVLSTLITGIISLITLSFAMVMVVLSNVSTTFSPKLILGLVSEKTHQVVLGNYIGAILYCLILLLLTSDKESHRFHDMAIILATAMGIWCLVLFIYFIHKISTSVQINNIVERIYTETKKELYRRQDEEESVAREIPNSVDETILPEYVFPSSTSGYLQKIGTTELVQLAEEHDLIIRVHPHLGDFVVKDSPFLACTKAPDQIDPVVQDRIFDTFIFFSGEKIEINARYGFTQLMEIAIKALSPGINDPGTACICIDYLTDLFVLWNGVRHSDVYYDDSHSPRLIVKSLSFETLFNICIGPIQRYGKEDLLVANKLLQSFQTLSYFDRKDEHYKRLLNEHAVSVIEDIKNSSSNDSDLRFLHARILEMNQAPKGYFSLPSILSSC
jgi:uncharacterized membrane protein